jgi:type IX secretion system PorP/SprF family membrane protein
MKKRVVIRVFIFCFVLLNIFNLKLHAQQQIENSMSQYFQNRLLWNPGFTGVDGNKIYALQNRSWVGFDGAPVLTAFSGELNFGKNSSAGMQVVSDVTGILYRTFGVFSYAYRIKLEEEKQLRIGISLSITGDRLDSRYLDASTAIDPLIVNNINQKSQYDGNIGLVYSTKHLTLGTSFFRISETLNGNSVGDANLAYLKMAAYYDIAASSDDKLHFKPLAMFRMFKATASVLDIGASMEYNKQFNALLMYQTSGNIRAGAGLKIQNWGAMNFYYSTNHKFTNSSSQQYELGFGFYIGKAKKDN